MSDQRLTVRDEQPFDVAAVRAINEAAFETPAEARLVDTLREAARPCLALVAAIGDDVVGHILFTPVTLDDRQGLVMGLAPMAVPPERQRQGIGTALVREGLARCAGLGAHAVVVLGHPGYYPRFGFVPAARFGLRCEYDVPEEAFMAIELVRGGLAAPGGTVRYHPAFAAV